MAKEQKITIRIDEAMKSFIKKMCGGESASSYIRSLVREKMNGGKKK